MMAYSKEMNDQVNDIVKKWANLQTHMHDGWTALHLACDKSPEMFRYIEKELMADKNIRT